MVKIPQSGTYGKFISADPSLYDYQRAAMERLTISGRASLCAIIQHDAQIAEMLGMTRQRAFMQQIMTGSSFQVIDGSTRSGAYWLSDGDNNRRFATLKREGNRTVIDIESFSHPGWSNINLPDMYQMELMAKAFRQITSRGVMSAKDLQDWIDPRPANPILKRSYIAVKRALVEWSDA